jgi:phage terminase large subunit-like protein
VSALAPQIPLQLPVKLLPVVQVRKRFKVLHGGRGGAKSHTVAQLLLMLSMQKRLRILCVREVQKSIRTSSMQVLRDYIARLGLSAYFEELKTEIRCRLTGSTFEFSGLKDHTADSIKSFEGVDITWVEEAHSVTARSWNVLIPTVIRKPGAEIWITFNPDDEEDYVYDRFLKNSDADALVIEVNWRDNPWFGEGMEDERRKLKAINDDLYQHVWEGKPRTAAGLLFKRPWLKRFDLKDLPPSLNRYMASDYASGRDPDNPDADPDWTEIGVWGIDPQGALWAIDWWSSQENVAEWYDDWIAMLKKHRPYAYFEEAGPILKAIDGVLDRVQRENHTFVHRIKLPPAGQKAERAMGFAARAAAGQVWIPNTPWGDRLVNQLCAFNGQDGRTDDMVDVCSLMARGLSSMANASLPAPELKPPPAPFTGAWLDQFDREDARTAADRARFYGR